jgi:phosphoglycolate phosphatase
MPSRFDLLVFDWDGTLMDSAAAIVSSLQAACRDFGYAVPSDERARYIIGLGLADAMAHILPDLPAEDYPRLVDRYREHYFASGGDSQLFAGARELLLELREAGFLLAVATGKSRRGLDLALETSGLKPVFDATRCGDEGFSKPHPGMLEYLMSELAVEKPRTLMIGDTIHDMAMALNAGVSRLGVSYGAHAREALLEYEPVACVAEFRELGAWLRTRA